MVPDVHERLFRGVCTDTRRRCETGELGDSDLAFIANLPSHAEGFGFDPAVGVQLRMGFLRMLSRNDPGRGRAERQPYQYDSRVEDLYECGLSVRQIARRIRVSKSNVARTVQEYRRGPQQPVFGFYRKMRRR